MFENSGETLKKFAKIMFVFSVIGSIILSFILKEIYDFEILFLLMYIICGVIFSYLGGLLLYAFGDLVENTNSLHYEIKKIAHELGKNDTGANSLSLHNSTDCVKKSVYSSGKTNSNLTSATSVKFVVCSLCGEENSRKNVFCNNCGAKL